MVDNVYRGIKIAEIAAAVSNNYRTIEECVEASDKIKDFNVEKFIKSTGVKGKYLCAGNQTCSDLCVAAAREIIDNNEKLKEEIGIVIYVTQSPDYRSPATACVIQHQLDISDNCVATDVIMGCSGFVVGLNIVAGLLQSCDSNKALLLCGDICGQDITRTENINSDYLLFGDAGTAILIEKTCDISDTLKISTKTNGNSVNKIATPGGMWRHFEWKYGNLMDGIEIFNFAVGEVTELIKSYVNSTEGDFADYDSIVLHQANLYIMKQMIKRIGVSKEKMSISIDKFGNTSCASIPLSIVNDYGNDDSHLVKYILACGFGVGLSQAVTSFKINVDRVHPIVHTDYYYNDCLKEEDY